MKKLIGVYLLLFICCVSLYGTIYRGQCGENAKWAFDFEGEVLTISGFGEMANYASKDDAPWKGFSWKIGKVIIGDSITSIGTNSFDILSHCSSVILGKSLIRINEKAFNYCKYFSELIIPDNVRFIGSQAFVDCSGIRRLYMGERVESVAASAFSGLNSLEEVQIKSLANWLKIKFENNTSNPLYYATYLSIDGKRIRNLIIPEGVDSLKSLIFMNLLVDTLSLPSSLQYFSNRSFLARDSLKSIKVHADNTIYDSRENCNAVIETATNTLIYGSNKSFIPNSVVSIDDYAFYSCNQLASLSIPDHVQHIGKDAFYGCKKLEIITIPHSVRVIEESTFSYCSNLKKVVLGSGVEQINKYAFFYCSSLDSIVCHAIIAPQLIDYPFYYAKKNVIIVCPEESDYSFWMKYENNDYIPFNLGWRLSNSKKPTVYEIWYTSTNGSAVSPNVSFWYNYNTYLSKKYPSIVNHSYYNGLGVIRFDMPIPYILSECYKNQTALKSIILPDSIENIEQYAFNGCSNLKSIHLPEEIRNIGNYCFNGCESLDSLYIPAKLNEITSLSFYNINNLRKIVVSEDNKTFDSRNNSNAIIRTTKNTLILGAAETVIPHTIRSIDTYAFYGNISLEELIIPDSVLSIEVAAFYNCTNLKKIELSKSLVSIGGTAFLNCKSLKNIDLPNSITNIGNAAFKDCKSLSFIDLPNSITNIGDDTFSGCQELVFIDLPEQIKTFPRISNCYKLKHITIGSKIEAIYQGAFYTCNQIQSITISTKQAPKINSHQDYNYFFYRQSGGPSVLYHPVGANYYNWMSSLSIFNFSEDTIPERKTSELWYRTTDGEPLLLDGNESFNEHLINNGYQAGYGILRYDAPVVKIDKDAFKGNAVLTSMTIPSTVENIGDNAFADCANLRTMTVEWNTPLAISDNVFENSQCKILYVPQNTRRLYENAPGWNKFQKIVQPYNYVEWIKLEKGDYEVREGDTLELKATVFPDDAVIRDLDWFSADNSIAIVKNGMVIGKKVGTVYIKARTKDGTQLIDSCLIKVTPVLANKISLNNQHVHMLRDHTVQLKAEIFPVRTTYKDVIWRSSDENILKVEEGVITALKAGMAKVYANTTDGTALVDSCEVKVEDYFPADVNWDSEFNISDVIGTVNFIMEKNTEGLLFEAADMNKDGYILVNDLKDVLDIILDSDVSSLSRESVQRKSMSFNVNMPELVMSDYLAINNADKRTSIGLVGGNKFAGIQCDLVLPSGISLLELKPGIDMDNHTVVSKVIGNGIVRIVVYSMNNDCFSSNATDLIEVNFMLDTEGPLEFKLQNIIATTPYVQTVRLNDETIVVEEAQTTDMHGYHAINDDEGQTTATYNLNGIKVNNNYKGVVIRKGKKLFIK